MCVFLSWPHSCCCDSFPLTDIKVPLSSVASRGTFLSSLVAKFKDARE